MKYRKLPVVIEAIVLKPSEQSIKEVLNFIGQEVDSTSCRMAEDRFSDYCNNKISEGSIIIKTLEGQHIASFGDYIIKGVEGEFYPCKPDIFAKTYEPVTN